MARTAEQVFEEIKSLDEEFIMFCDDHSFIDPERMRRIAEMLLEAGIKKRYFAYARTDSIVWHKDIYALWAKAGLSLVMSGLEAIDGKALKQVGKKTDIEVNEEAVRIAGELGFGISAGFLVEPHFVEEDFEKIDKYARERPSIVLTEYTPLTPFPGTPLYSKMKGELLTHNPAFFDLQHFVLPTYLPAKAIYKLQLKFYSRSVRRFIMTMLKYHLKHVLTFHSLKLVGGLIKNSRAYKNAHLDFQHKQMEKIT